LKSAIKVCEWCFLSVTETCESDAANYNVVSNGRALKKSFSMITKLLPRIKNSPGWKVKLIVEKNRVEMDAAVRQAEFEAEKIRLEKERESRVERVRGLVKALRLRNPLWQTDFLLDCPPYKELIVYKGPLWITSYQLSLYEARIAICKSRLIINLKAMQKRLKRQRF
jgi:hypothetical protein